MSQDYKTKLIILSDNHIKHEFLFSEEKEYISASIKRMLTSESSIFIVDIGETEYIYPKQWLIANAVMTVSRISDAATEAGKDAKKGKLILLDGKKDKD